MVCSEVSSDSPSVPSFAWNTTLLGLAPHVAYSTAPTARIV